MTRRVFTVASLLSLALCLATAALWVRSYWWAEGIGFGAGYHIGSQQGRLWVETIEDLEHAYEWRPGRYAIRLNPRYEDSPWDEFATARDTRWSVAGFGYFAGRRAVRSYSPDADLNGLWDLEFVRAAFAPYCSICLLFALLPASVAHRTCVAFHRRMRGRCHACGYDLRSTPGRCPECGAVPAEAKTWAASYSGPPRQSHWHLPWWRRWFGSVACTGRSTGRAPRAAPPRSSY